MFTNFDVLLIFFIDDTIYKIFCVPLAFYCIINQWAGLHSLFVNWISDYFLDSGGIMVPMCYRS